MGKGRMRSELKPNVHAEISNGVDCRSKLDRLADAASPMLSTASFAGKTISSNCAEEWDAFRLWSQIGQRVFQRFRCRLHHWVMKRVIDTDHPGEHTLRLQFGQHRLDGVTRTGQR